MRTIAWMLNLYPRRWRERYQEEMLAVLEQHTISLATILDLLLGALDARLDPAYRTQEGFMFHRLRDPRTLSLVYICTLAISFFSANFWSTLHHSLAFVDNSTGVLTDSLVVIGLFALPAFCLLALFIITGTTLLRAMKQRQFGTLLFAIICFGLGVAGVFRSLSFSVGPDYPVLDLIFVWLLVGGIAFCLGTGLFVAGVKGRKLLLAGQRWPLLFALAIILLPPSATLLYQLWGVAGSLPLSASAIIFLYELAPYLPLGALLLALASDEPGERGWRVIRGFGVVLACALVLNLVAVVVWDINRWVGGGVWIFDPTRGVWPLFGRQWIGPLITNALILTFAFGLALLALIRSFLIRPENEQSERQLAVKA